MLSVAVEIKRCGRPRADTWEAMAFRDLTCLICKQVTAAALLLGCLPLLDAQVQIRRLPKPVIAMVAGYAVGGGHILHMICDLTVRVFSTAKFPRPVSPDLG